MEKLADKIFYKSVFIQSLGSRTHMLTHTYSLTEVLPYKTFFFLLLISEGL